MKKTVFLLITLFSLSAVSAFAEEDNEAPDDDRQEMQEMQTRKMGGHMMKGMHKPSVVATSDGGIVIVDGPKIAKYDAQLNLVKEVELKHGPKPMDSMPDKQAPPAPAAAAPAAATDATAAPSAVQ